MKDKTQKQLRKNIEKYNSQEKIILKVLDIINSEEGQQMLKEKDQDLEQ
jgi:hypothetical protein